MATEKVCKCKAAEIQALQSEIDRLKQAISHARGGLDLAYECLEKKLYDEAMLHIGHHATRLHNLT